MALNSSGQISIGGSTAGQSINLELGRSATATSNLNETDLRTLAGVSSGTISISDFYGKSSEFRIERSLRFNNNDNAKLYRQIGNPTSSGTWTFSCWVKRSEVFGSNSITLFSARSGTNPIQIYFPGGGDDRLRFYDDGRDMYTDHRFRDPAAWAHIVVTRTPTANSIYVNGVLEKTSTFSSRTTSNANVNGANHALGMLYFVGSATGFYGDFYLAESFFIDGQALAPSNFGEYDNDDVWNPKDYSGSYGNNGWRLKFDSNSSTSNLGNDSSGNGNTFTTSGLSVSAGIGNDSLRDSPSASPSQTDTGVGGQISANYAVLNWLSNNGTLSNGNTTISMSTSYKNARSTLAFPTSGKWYVEAYVHSATGSAVGANIGFATNNADLSGGYGGKSDVYMGNFADQLRFYNQTSVAAASGSLSAGTIIQLAYDADNNKAWIGINNTWRNSSGGTNGNPATGANQTFSIPTTKEFFAYIGGYNNTITANFGARPFSYTAPSGFKCLCTANLPTPAVANGKDAFDIKLWTGNGSNSRSITGYEFSPDFVWIKRRNGYRDHALFDIVRGTTKTLRSNTNGHEQTYSTSLTSFNSDGFTIGGLSLVNTNTAPYVGWAWDAGSSTVTNSVGSFDSQVRANQTAGFSIVKANIGSGNVGHGLNAVPSLIFTKSLNTGNWIVHGNVFSSPASNYLVLNSTDSVFTNTSAFNNTAPTSSTFNFNAIHFYGGNRDCVSYCFAPVEGYSAFGSYVGSGNSNGPFVYTGFRPRFILVKALSTVSYGNWVMHDTARSAHNVSTTNLYANRSNPEDTSYWFDLLSNGFKVRSNAFDGTNGWMSNYLYAAFAEHPLNSARAR